MIIYSGIVFLDCHLVITILAIFAVYNFGCRCQEEEKKGRKKEDI
jgi:hypothetical protein